MMSSYKKFVKTDNTTIKYQFFAEKNWFTNLSN